MKSAAKGFLGGSADTIVDILAVYAPKPVSTKGKQCSWVDRTKLHTLTDIPVLLALAVIRGTDRCVTIVLFG